MADDRLRQPLDASTLTEVLSSFERDGFTGQFAAAPDGRVRCYSCREVRPADELVVEALRRLEGASDPADMLAVAATICPACHAKGTLILNYGPEATPEDSEVLVALESPG